MALIDRYSRQTLFPEIGEEGQERLGNSNVAIIGCGALGTIRLSPAYSNTREEIDFTLEAIERIVQAGSLQEQCAGLAQKEL